MAKKVSKVGESAARYYDARGVVGEIVEGPVEFALDAELKGQILDGKRTRRLENVSIKLDRAQIQAVRKIATMKSMPYQTLIRHWLGEAIRHELRLDAPRRRARRTPAEKRGEPIRRRGNDVGE